MKKKSSLCLALDSEHFDAARAGKGRVHPLPSRIRFLQGVMFACGALSPPHLATPLPGRKKKEIKLKVKHKVRGGEKKNRHADSSDKQLHRSLFGWQVGMSSGLLAGQETEYSRDKEEKMAGGRGERW
ncbi:uncharacterized protein AKAME5_001506200 [Lates japonicus]|uniref:Uncharacterized protein n=1 Tax=Lates japonicus TaxID=270547 RepID=A0AAD3RC98_LATJO|nr:uncharacterized protein AKAME5_001506200 [Lates japonicus]